MLRNSIEKPKVLYADDPILTYGFLNLINIFETLTVNLYDWVSTGCDSRYSELPPTRTIQSNLSNQITLDGVLEIQQVDILITQQWLQAKMWALSFLAHHRHRHSSSSSSSQQSIIPISTTTRGPVLPFHLPILVGKAVMDVISSVSQGALDAHGIGMVRSPHPLSFLLQNHTLTNPLHWNTQEQKLFDLGTSIADVACSLRLAATQRLALTIIDPRELLWGMLNALSKSRGSQSYLFPELLERSRSILGLDTPSNTIIQDVESDLLFWVDNADTDVDANIDNNINNHDDMSDDTENYCEVENGNFTLGMASALVI